VDDHPLFRQGLRALVDSVPDLEVVAEAGSGEEAVDAAGAVEPDVVVMDLHMPGGDGISATRQLGEAAPGVSVLVLTMFEDDDSVFAAMRAGARGYLLKDADPADVAAAIRAVARGEVVFGAGIAQRLLQFFATAFPPGAPYPFPELTRRERDVLDLMARGVGNAEIAHRLLLQPKTVRNRVSCIFTKMQVADRARAIVLAREAGLGRRSE
jgi:DNA-binding NarL/FixJ family response regulator